MSNSSWFNDIFFHLETLADRQILRLPGALPRPLHQEAGHGAAGGRTLHCT